MRNFKMTNFLDIIHRVILIKNTRRFGDWSLFLSSGKKTLILLRPIDRASPYLQTGDLLGPTEYVSFYVMTETDYSL
jgi:hypothetical protein